HRHPSLPQRRIWLTSEPSMLAWGSASAAARRRRRARSWRTERLLNSEFVCMFLLLCTTPIQEYFSSGTSSTTLDSSPLRHRPLECGHQRGQLDQHLDRQRSFRSRLTQTCPASQQADGAQRPALTHVQAAFGALTLE